MTAAAERLWPSVARLLAENRYLVLATADADGMPWATPVFFAARDEYRLHWVSSPDSRHSHNLAVRPDLAITVFDSTVPVGGAQALYLEATARETADTDIAAALDVLNDGIPPERRLVEDDLRPAGRLVVYTAEVHRHHVLVAAGDPSFGNAIDLRVEVRAPR